MSRFRKSATLAVALAVAATALPGCVVAIGGKHGESGPDRVKALEGRMKVVEDRLGIAAATTTPTTTPSAEVK